MLAGHDCDQSVCQLFFSSEGAGFPRPTAQGVLDDLDAHLLGQLGLDSATLEVIEGRVQLGRSRAQQLSSLLPCQYRV